MTFPYRIVVREIDEVAGPFEALVREIDISALVLQNHPKSIRLFEHSENNLT
jgi:hypothetical protein